MKWKREEEHEEDKDKAEEDEEEVGNIHYVKLNNLDSYSRKTKINWIFRVNDDGDDDDDDCSGTRAQKINIKMQRSRALNLNNLYILYNMCNNMWKLLSSHLLLYNLP